MSRVLVTYETRIPTVSSIYNAFIKQFKNYIRADFSFRKITNVGVKDLEECDILFLIRPNDVISERISRIASQKGIFTISFFDDDLLNLPKDLPLSSLRKRMIIKTLSNSHLLCSSSRYICEKYSSLTKQKRSAIINTAVGENEISEVKRKNSVVKILYAAGAAHVGLFNKYILPCMSDLAELYGKRIQFTFIGLHPSLDAFQDKMDIKIIKGMPLDEYRHFVRENIYDIGIAPLNMDEFSKCKYFNKYMEYSMMGIAGIYTRTEPYTFVVNDGENGILTSNDKEAWLKALRSLIEDSALREKIAKNAQLDLKTNFSIAKICQDLLKEIPELESISPQKKKIQVFSFSKILYKCECLYNRIYIFFFYLKNQGIKTVISKIKVHFKERALLKDIKE